jgi:hypothetical protein
MRVRSRRFWCWASFAGAGLPFSGKRPEILLAHTCRRSYKRVLGTTTSR